MISSAKFNLNYVSPPSFDTRTHPYFRCNILHAFSSEVAKNIDISAKNAPFLIEKYSQLLIRTNKFWWRKPDGAVVSNFLPQPLFHSNYKSGGSIWRIPLNTVSSSFILWHFSVIICEGIRNFSAAVGSSLFLIFLTKNSLDMCQCKRR